MNKLYLVKYGGNAMVDDAMKKALLQNILKLKEVGNQVIIVHGGGPFIKVALERANIKSEFFEGQRITSKNALLHVEAALKGTVNGDLVGILNALGHKAVGLSGKDGKIVTAKKRYGFKRIDGKQVQVDLGQVGDVEHVDTDLLQTLLAKNFIPVITCIAADENGNDYNINADVFAGAVAGALQVDEFLVLTDVDGLLRDISDKSSLMHEVRQTEIDELIAKGVIKGGMLPKLEACKSALNLGAASVRIMNGTKPEQIEEIKRQKKVGTRIIH